MFTGLIEEVGVVRRLERVRDGGRLHVQARTVLEGTAVGDSIAVSGVCLTVVELASDGFVADCMAETLSQTTLGQARADVRVNLERSLALGARMGGHLVLGHVDAVAEILGIESVGDSWSVTVSLPKAVEGCVAPKGSIAVDGISLTVAAVEEGWFRVGIIPHTFAVTSLRDARAGRKVNIEADVLARYVLQTLRTLGTAAGATVKGGLTETLLREQGFA